MSDNAKASPAPAHCPVCGSSLPRGTPIELCPSCLVRAGLPSEESVGPMGTIRVGTALSGMGKGLPHAGEQFGNYKLIRVLGGGGMGMVYEAEEVESSRRVALKLLAQALDSPEARKR